MNASRSAARTCLLGLCLSAVACESRLTSVGDWADSGYLEAEGAVMSGGFGIGSDSAASAGQFLVAPSGVKSENGPGEDRAVYDFTVYKAGTFRIWGRIRSPDAEHNRFWVRVDNGDWMKWRISVGDIWYWDAFHDNTDYGHPRNYPLQPGPHQLTLANCADDVELDRLYFTSIEGDVPPGNDTPCHPPHSIQLKGVCEESCGNQGGNQCGVPACTGHQPFYAYDCGPACCFIAP